METYLEDVLNCLKSKTIHNINYYCIFTIIIITRTIYNRVKNEDHSSSTVINKNIDNNIDNKMFSDLIKFKLLTNR